MRRPRAPLSPSAKAIRWWEQRRPLFNLVLLITGLATIFIVFRAGEDSVPPGEDVVEPALMWVAIIGYGVAANCCYTLGWVSELLWSGGETGITERRRPLIFRLGLIFSVIVTLLPAFVALLLVATASRSAEKTAIGAFSTLAESRNEKGRALDQPPAFSSRSIGPQRVG